MNEINADKLVGVYVKIRDKRRELQKAYEQEDAELSAQMDIVSANLLDLMRDIEVDSLKTSKGTVSRTVKTRYWPSDWQSMYEFIKEHDAIHLLEQRVHQTNMRTFLTEHPDLLPAGLNSDSKYAVSVRKK